MNQTTAGGQSTGPGLLAGFGRLKRQASAWIRGSSEGRLPLNGKREPIPRELSAFERQLEALRPLSDISNLLHALRTYELAAVPKGADVFLSAGCAGRWYFDWVDQTYGHVKRHIGVEYFSPQPPELPANVTWVSNTVGDMSAVPDSSVDLIFSGQNIEHLWLQDLVGFLAEAFRTLRQGGRLVIDSPNRLVTRPLAWRHPEHTMELTPDEIRKLLEMSGFADIVIRGLWIVRDPATEALLPLDPQSEVKAWPLLRRVAAANVNPNHSFLWWAEARKDGSPPARPVLEGFLTDLYRQEWPVRVRQTSTQGPLAENGRIALSPAAGSYALYGPYIPMPPGEHTVTFFIRKAGRDRNTGAIATCDICEGGQNSLASRIVDHSELSEDFRPISIPFKLEDTKFGLEFRVRVESSTSLAVRTEVALNSDSAYLKTC